MSLTAIHLVDEGVYLLKKGYGHEYEVAGLLAPDGEFVVSSLTNIVRVERRAGEIAYWKDADGNTLLALDYNNKLTELLSGAERDDDGDYTFPSLDAEFEYKKFRARWKTPERAAGSVTRTPVDVAVAEVRVRSGDEDIVSLWNSPDLQHDQRLYRFSRDPVMVREAAAQCAANGLTYENGMHRGYLRFAKIEGVYAFDDSFNESRRSFIGTLEQCKAEKAKCIDRVTSIIRVHSAMKRGAALRNAGEVLLSLRGVLRQLQGVYAKQSSTSSLASIRTQLAAVVSGLEADIAEGGPK